MTPSYNSPSTRPYLLLVVGVLLLALAGYSGYVLYPRFNLPPVAGSGLLVLAMAAGIAAFFSPCAFPLLATLLARETGEGAGRCRRALRFALALALGASGFLLLTGAGIALGAGMLFRDVTFTSTVGRLLRAVIGSGLILLGFAQLGRLPFSFGTVEEVVRPLLRKQAHLRRRNPTMGFALYGFAYVLAGFG
ncbi:MAG: cytochrome c biogenesis protein CcdA [Ardenticatenaceae bacterium]